MGIFPRSQKRISREAADWAVKLGEGASEDVRGAFNRWHDADPRHAEAFARMRGIWKGAEQVSPGRVRPGAREPARVSSGTPRLLLAASLIVLAALASLFLFSPDRPAGPGAAPGGGGGPAPAPGAARAAARAARSRVTLDYATPGEAEITSVERRLTLHEGRARFRVARDSRPFIVRAGASEIVATGTMFDVSFIEGRVHVLLLEGSVDVRQVGAAADAPLSAPRLAPGELLTLAQASRPDVTRATRPEMAWPTGMLEFDQTPLGEAAALVNRSSRVKLRLAGERVRALPVSGAYRTGDAEGFARSVAAALDLRLETGPDGSLLLSDPGGRGAE
jgi:transmembrane sensor